MAEIELDKTSYSRESRALNPEHQATLDKLRHEQTVLLNNGEYKASHAVKLSRDAVEARMQQERVEREKARQAKERMRLDRGWNVERERFEREWSERGALLEADNARRIRVLGEVHMYAFDEYEAQLARRCAGMHYRMSKSLLEYSRTERQLGVGERFDEAVIVKKRADQLRKREERLFDGELAAKFDAERTRLAASHKVEMDNLVQKCHALKVAHERERNQAFAVLKLKYSNLDKDASHAFLMEFKSPPVCDVIPTCKSRGQHCSTFRGTIKLESLAGSKSAVPNLSQLPEPPIEDVDPTLAPWLSSS